MFKENEDVLDEKTINALLSCGKKILDAKESPLKCLERELPNDIRVKRPLQAFNFSNHLYYKWPRQIRSEYLLLFTLSIGNIQKNHIATVENPRLLQDYLKNFIPIINQSNSEPDFEWKDKKQNLWGIEVTDLRFDGTDAKKRQKKAVKMGIKIDTATQIIPDSIKTKKQLKEIICKKLESKNKFKKYKHFWLGINTSLFKQNNSDWYKSFLHDSQKIDWLLVWLKDYFSNHYANFESGFITIKAQYDFYIFGVKEFVYSPKPFHSYYDLLFFLNDKHSIVDIKNSPIWTELVHTLWQSSVKKL